MWINGLKKQEKDMDVRLVIAFLIGCGFSLVCLFIVAGGYRFDDREETKKENKGNSATEQ